jgi:diaminopimelate decarboxylase
MRLPVNYNTLETPYYFYDIELLNSTIEAALKACSDNNFRIHYAMKANANSEILKTINRHGIGIDCVSGNELKKALECGFNSSDIVFAGVGKSDNEIKLAINSDIHAINIESEEELEVINTISGELNKVTDIALRVNPDIDAGTHKHITTGTCHNKFGISIADIHRIVENSDRFKSVNIVGLHFHIGSQINGMEAFVTLCNTINSVQNSLLNRGVVFKHLNVGGGLGIDYNNPDRNPIVDFNNYFDVFRKYLNYPHKQTVHFELGRSITGQCGSLITKVLYTKSTSRKRFAIVDAGMTDLIRPALYNAYHKIENLTSTAIKLRYDVVGPICESSDYFGKNTLIPETKRGDILCIRSVGAYGQVMASQYNLREPAKEYYSDMIETINHK